MKFPRALSAGAFIVAAGLLSSCALVGHDEKAPIGVGAKAPDSSLVLLDGTRKSLDENWTYWQGPGFASSLPIKWKAVEDPVDPGSAGDPGRLRP